MMQFDTADLAEMEADGSLVRVIIHEMGHVLGFGTIWDRVGLRQGAGTINPTFTGANAMREFGTLQGLHDAGPGSRSPTPAGPARAMRTGARRCSATSC